jgi:hypothetical protein
MTTPTAEHMSILRITLRLLVALGGITAGYIAASAVAFQDPLAAVFFGLVGLGCVYVALVHGLD